MAPTVCEMKVVAMSTSPQKVAVSAQMPNPSVALSIACARAQAPPRVKLARASTALAGEHSMWKLRNRTDSLAQHTSVVAHCQHQAGALEPRHSPWMLLCSMSCPCAEQLLHSRAMVYGRSHTVHNA